MCKALDLIPSTEEKQQEETGWAARANPCKIELNEILQGQPVQKASQSCGLGFIFGRMQRCKWDKAPPPGKR